MSAPIPSKERVLFCPFCGGGTLLLGEDKFVWTCLKCNNGFSVAVAVPGNELGTVSAPKPPKENWPPLVKVMEALKKAQEDRDTEEAHLSADSALEELLDALGYQQVTDAYAKVSKWYG